MDPRREDREREPAPTNINPQQQAQPIQEQPEPYNIPPAQSVTRRSRPQTPSTLDKFEGDAFSPPELHRDGTTRGVHSPLPPLPQARSLPGVDSRIPRLRGVESHISAGPRSGIDWIVPIEEKVSVFPSFQLGSTGLNFV